jgi:hypothetical protein
MGDRESREQDAREERADMKRERQREGRLSRLRYGPVEDFACPDDEDARSPSGEPDE